MPAIKYTNILNSFVSTEGSDGFMTNYVCYSILVVYEDGTRQVVEGKTHEVSFLFAYARTPIDELLEIKETISSLRKDINDIVDQKMKYVVDSLYPIPDILNTAETEALKKITDAGLIPVLENQYPESTPPNGIVRAFHRDPDQFKKIHVKIIHVVPIVEGLKIDDALAQLKDAGFTASVTYKVVSGKENGIVLNCSRADANKLNVGLEVSSAIPETKGMAAEEARRVLQNEGYIVNIEKQVHPSRPGTVISWTSMSEKKIILFVSIPEKYKSKYVDVKWTDMQDSTGDLYGAIAEFYNKTGTLSIKLSYTISSKAKHYITGIDCKAVIGHPKPQITAQTMEPDTKGLLNISLPFKRPFEELPANMSFSLETQYGLMKKKDCVTLQFAFDWE